MTFRFLLSISVLVLISFASFSQHSVARRWNEELLEAIRNDYARPTVHARNLFHTSILLYDCWAAYSEGVDTYFLGKELHGFSCTYSPIATDNPREDMEEAMSYAAYRLMKHRFLQSPNAFETLTSLNNLMNDLGYDVNVVSTDYSDGSAAALGNYMAERLIEYGLQDGSNEENYYSNEYYEPINPPLLVEDPGNPDILDVNRWQPLSLTTFIDQSGNIIPGSTPEFLSPEWGNVLPFSLTDNDLSIYERDGNNYWVYHDPGIPPYMDVENIDENSEEYKWTFELVTVWSSHLDPNDGVLWDISPGAIGNLNIDNFPTTWSDYHNFYDLEQGGDPGTGRAINPKTGQTYQEQLVPRGDYARVLAEFWADGPDSETPPGHWFTILNYVNDHPDLVKKFKGEGEVIDDLEWDVKSYFILAGAMHDVAITAWGIKGYYDYIRPVSAIRAMADRGQSTNQALPNYNPSGISLKPGFIELVETGDPLAGVNDENVGKIKLFAWRGHSYINDTEVDEAGVGWILAENWWPYQRPSFVTPPFAGYVSGHSTYSRAAAEVLTLLTGDPYFPGGMGEFHAPKDEFLVFEDGPSVDLTLQWATYRDASDQCSLSRIWGGIHPPADDIRGRFIGETIGVEAFELAERYFNNQITSTIAGEFIAESKPILAKNPVTTNISILLQVENTLNAQISLLDLNGQLICSKTFNNTKNLEMELPTGIGTGLYIVQLISDGQLWSKKVLVR